MDNDRVNWVLIVIVVLQPLLRRWCDRPAMGRKPNQIVLLMTDGVFEARSVHGHLFGVARALDTVRANRDKTAQQIVDIVYNAVLNHFQDIPPMDDIAVIVIKVQSVESSLDQVKIGRWEGSTGFTSQ